MYGQRDDGAEMEAALLSLTHRAMPNVFVGGQFLGGGAVLAHPPPLLADHRQRLRHLIVTGRNAPDALIEVADLVTEMTMVKHPFRSGVKAQAGIEF